MEYYTQTCMYTHSPSTVHSVQFTQYSSLSTVHSVQFTQYSSPSTVHSVQFTQYSSPSTVHPVQFPQYSSPSTVPPVQFTQYCLPVNVRSATPLLGTWILSRTVQVYCPRSALEMFLIVKILPFSENRYFSDVLI